MREHNITLIFCYLLQYLNLSQHIHKHLHKVQNLNRFWSILSIILISVFYFQQIQPLFYNNIKILQNLPTTITNFLYLCFKLHYFINNIYYVDFKSIIPIFYQFFHFQFSITHYIFHYIFIIIIFRYWLFYHFKANKSTSFLIDQLILY